MFVRAAVCVSALLWALLVIVPSVGQAVPVSFSGTLELRLFGEVASTGGAGVADVNNGVSPASFTLPSGAFALTTSLAPSSGNLVATIMNGVGSFGGPSGGFGGAMPFLGSVAFSIPGITYVTSSFSTSTTTISFVWNASVLGGGGSDSQTFSISGQNFNATLVGGTFGTGTVAGVAGFDGRVAGVGVLQMVAPVSVLSGQIAGGQADGVVVLNLTFVPEPSTGVLCGLGAAVMGWIGRCRRLERSVG